MRCVKLKTEKVESGRTGTGISKTEEMEGEINGPVDFAGLQASFLLNSSKIIIPISILI